MGRRRRGGRGGNLDDTLYIVASEMIHSRPLCWPDSQMRFMEISRCFAMVKQTHLTKSHDKMYLFTALS